MLPLVTGEARADRPSSAPLKERGSASGADVRRWTSLKRLYEKSAAVWMGIIVYGLVVQAFRSAEMSRRRARFLGNDDSISRPAQHDLD